MLRCAPDSIVRLLHSAPAPVFVSGKFPPDGDVGIVTSVPATGILLSSQLVVMPQLVEVVPVHKPGITGTAKVNIARGTFEVRFPAFDQVRGSVVG